MLKLKLTSLKIVSFILLLLLSVTQSHSQVEGFKSRRYNINDGLSQNTVYCTLQDRNGFVWIGTRSGGLERFDGLEFKHHKSNPHLPHSIGGNEVLNLMEDHKGHIWAGLKNRGLSRYDPETELFHNYFPNANDTTSLCAATVYSMCEDADGQVWLGTAWGLCIYNREDDNFIRVTKDHEKEFYKGISCVRVYDDQHVLVAVIGEGLFLLSTKTKKVVKRWLYNPEKPYGIASKSTSSVVVDRKKQIWVGTRNAGISRLGNIDSENFVHISNDPNDNTSLAYGAINSLTEDSKGNIWVSTPNGLSVISSDQTQSNNPKFIHYRNHVNDNYSLSQNSAYEIMEDNSGEIWVGTWSAGFNHISLKQSNFDHITENTANDFCVKPGVVRCFHQIGDLLYIGSQGGGLNIMDLNTGMFEYVQQDWSNNGGLNSSWIECIYSDKNDNIYLGTKDGLSIYKPETNEVHNIAQDLDFTSIIEGSENNIYFLTSKGTYVLDQDVSGNNAFKYSDNDFVKEDNVVSYSSLKDANGHVWLGTLDGIVVYKGSAENKIKYSYSRNDSTCVSSNVINALGMDLNNNIWVGTAEGLSLYRSETDDFLSFGEWDGLPSNEIDNVVADNEGYIWISTSKGLSRFKYLANKSTRKEMLSELTTFTVEDGLQNGYYTTDCFLKADDGRLFIGGKDGVNYFRPDEIRFNENKPRLAFTDFRLFNQSAEIGTKDSPLPKGINYLEEIELNHKQSVFSIHYAALNYLAPEKNTYAYMMEGLETEWNYVGTRREANYTNLPAGEYVFKVKAANNDGIWNEEGAEIKVIVNPIWYATWWFKIIVIVLSVATLGYLLRRRAVVLKERRMELERKVAEATAESESKNSSLTEAKQKLDAIVIEVKEKLGQTSQELLEATNSQASTIEEISASIEQMAKDINDNADGASKMYENARTIEKDSEVSVEVVGKTVESIKDISEGIKYITEFARTTNILSLNATIEAAKAGSYGRSFGVVANEVKKLADSSHDVAANIKMMSENGLELSNMANEKILELQDYIKDIVALIAQIRESSQSQSYEAANVNQAIQQISVYINGTSGLAEKLDDAINSLSVN